MICENRAPWQNPRVLVTLLLVFLCGSLAGALTMRYGVGSSVPKSGAYWAEGGKEISMQRFTKELDLTPDQAEKMETILDDFVMYYQMLQAQMDEVRATGKSKIVRLLNADQKHKFEKMLSELQSKQLR